MSSCLLERAAWFFNAFLFLDSSVFVSSILILIHCEYFVILHNVESLFYILYDPYNGWFPETYLNWQEIATKAIYLYDDPLIHKCIFRDRIHLVTVWCGGFKSLYWIHMKICFMIWSWALSFTGCCRLSLITGNILVLHHQPIFCIGVLRFKRTHTFDAL